MWAHVKKESPNFKLKFGCVPQEFKVQKSNQCEKANAYGPNRLSLPSWSHAKNGLLSAATRAFTTKPNSSIHLPPHPRAGHEVVVPLVSFESPLAPNATNAIKPQSSTTPPHITANAVQHGRPNGPKANQHTRAAAQLPTRARQRRCENVGDEAGKCSSGESRLASKVGIVAC
jgi:hypothetical protein